MPEFARWDSFYSIVGTAAGALIGLQFVVMTLIASNPPLRAADAGAAFSSPTVVHFGTALFLSALQRVPWPGVIFIAAHWGIIGAIGAVYSLIVVRRIKKQTTYRPVFEDWLFHVVLPLIAYIILVFSSVTALFYTQETLFAVGGAVMLFLFIGIHNAWDSVSYHVLYRSSNNPTKQHEDETSDDEKL
ncbi:MAG: hypothetical protein Q8933_21555 [Bacteroidota bacterium]|nr:hypothetical protein [Bacteroidota bacterium]